MIVPAAAQRPFDGDALEAEASLAQHLHPRVGPRSSQVERIGVQPGDLGDRVGRELLALVAEALAHLGAQLAGVDQRDLAGAARGACGW